MGGLSSDGTAQGVVQQWSGNATGSWSDVDGVFPEPTWGMASAVGGN